jgi:hypothetical protein
MNLFTGVSGVYVTPKLKACTKSCKVNRDCIPKAPRPNTPIDPRLRSL